MKITVSVIKADVGGIGGHTRPSDALIDAVKETVKNSGDLLIDHYIGYCGDDVHIVMSHTKGVDNKDVHKEIKSLYPSLFVDNEGQLTIVSNL